MLNALPFSQPRQRFVDRDPREPRGKSRASLELAQMLIGADVRFLHHVLRLGAIAHNGHHHAAESLVVSPHDDFVEFKLPAQYAVDHFLIGPTFHASLFQHLHICPRV